MKRKQGLYTSADLDVAGPEDKRDVAVLMLQQTADVCAACSMALESLDGLFAGGSRVGEDVAQSVIDAVATLTYESYENTVMALSVIEDAGVD